MADETKKAKRRGVILDGYTIEHTISSPEGFFDDTTVRFRPVDKMKGIEISRQITKASAKDVMEGEKIANQVIVDHLKEWDQTMPDPEDEEKEILVPIKLEYVSKLEPHLGADIFNLIMGYTPATDREASLKN